MAFLNTIEGMICASAILAFVFALILRRRRGELLVLIIVPFAAAVYAQVRLIGLPAEVLRSTSALDVIFATIWAGVGALIGYFGARLSNNLRVS